MSQITNRGASLLLSYAFRAATRPTNYYVALVTSAVAPTVDTNTLSELTEISAGTGYTAGGIQLTPNSTDFDTLTEDDSGDVGFVQIRDLVWTASGGNLGAARYAVLTTDEATAGNRQIIAYFDLSADRTVSDTQSLTLQNLDLRLSLPA